MCEAPQFDRRHIPAGIWFFQKSIGSPKQRVSMLAARKYAAEESP
jgi:hypothetical protein